jgi:hypothetical protein
LPGYAYPQEQQEQSPKMVAEYSTNAMKLDQSQQQHLDAKRGQFKQQQTDARFASPSKNRKARVPSVAGFSNGFQLAIRETVQEAVESALRPLRGMPT